MVIITELCKTDSKLAGDKFRFAYQTFTHEIDESNKECKSKASQIDLLDS